MGKQKILIALAEDKEKLLFDNEKSEKQQKKLQQEIEKMVQSKALKWAEKVNKHPKRAFEIKQSRRIDRMADMEKKAMIRLFAKILSETDLYDTDMEVQNLIDWICVSE